MNITDLISRYSPRTQLSCRRIVVHLAVGITVEGSNLNWWWARRVKKGFSVQLSLLGFSVLSKLAAQDQFLCGTPVLGGLPEERQLLRQSDSMSSFMIRPSVIQQKLWGVKDGFWFGLSTIVRFRHFRFSRRFGPEGARKILDFTANSIVC